MTSGSGPRPRKGSRSTRTFLLLGGALLAVAVCTLITLALLPVAGFSVPESGDALDARARQFEQSFASEFSRIRVGTEPWAIRIREGDLNAWFWTRLPDWMAHLEGRDSVGTTPFLQVELDQDRVRLISASMAVAFIPAIHERSTLIQPDWGSAVGRLPVPPAFFRWSASSIDLENLTKVLVGAQAADAPSRSFDRPPADGLTWPAQFPLGDGRTVELLEIQLGDRELVLVFQTST